MLDQQKYSNLEQYLNKDVLQLGHEAEGMECQVVPVLLRLKIEHILVDKKAEGEEGFKKLSFPPQLGKTKFMNEDQLNFHDKEINLWITPGHYNLLYSHKWWGEIGEEVEAADTRIREKIEEIGKNAGVKNVQKEEKKPVGEQEEKKSEEQVKLSCADAHSVRSLLAYLLEEFGAERTEGEKLNCALLFPLEMVKDEKRGERLKRAECWKCGRGLTFNDFQAIGFKLIRSEFKKQKEKQEEWKEEKEAESEEKKKGDLRKSGSLKIMPLKQSGKYGELKNSSDQFPQAKDLNLTKGGPFSASKQSSLMEEILSYQAQRKKEGESGPEQQKKEEDKRDERVQIPQSERIIPQSKCKTIFEKLCCRRGQPKKSEGSQILSSQPRKSD